MGLLAGSGHWFEVGMNMGEGWRIAPFRIAGIGAGRDL
jgi:hypothetical protein